MFASPLKEAFAAARCEANIDLVLDPLLASRLYVYGKSLGGEPASVFITRGPDERFCWTAGDDLALAQATPGVSPMPYDGAGLLRDIPKGQGLVLVWGDGGDFLSVEHLAWLRRLWVEREVARG